MMTLVSPLIVAVGVVEDPATVVPLGCPEPLPPANAGCPQSPAATTSKGKTTAFDKRDFCCKSNFIIVQP
jgi:hypothetical protein